MSLVATSWIFRSGPPGRYGAPDAGLIGYYLDGRRSVVDLDGLTNTFDFASKLRRGTSIFELERAEGVRYLVARRLPGTPDAPNCATILWSSDPVPYGGGFDQPFITRIPIRVFDLGSCSSR